MFLTENNIGNAPDAFEFSSFLSEADNAYARVCMGMARTEHTAIMSESMEMLSEGLEEFKDKAKKIGERVKAKFFAFLDRVKAEWSKLIAKIQTMFSGVRASSLKKSANMLYLNDHKVQLPTNLINNVSAIQKEFLDMKNSNDIEDITVSEKEIKDLERALIKAWAGVKDVAITTQLVDFAEKFLISDRKALVANIESVKKAAIKLAKYDLRDEDDADNKHDGRLAISRFSSCCSKLIVNINKLTGPCVKIISTWKKATSYKKYGDKDDSRYGVSRKRNGTVERNSSVYDSFDDIF